MIRTCLFDMGNVLVNFSHEQMCRQIGELCGRTAAQVRAVLFDSGLQLAFERGEVSPAEFQRRVESAVEGPIEAKDLRRAACEIFEPNAEIVTVLDALKRQGIRLVLLSNTSIWHFEHVRQSFDVLNRFDDLVASYQVGALKPDAAMFDAALSMIQCDASECFFTDDILENIEAARRHGLHAEVFIGTQELTTHLRVHGIDLKGCGQPTPGVAGMRNSPRCGTQIVADPSLAAELTVRGRCE